MEDDLVVDPARLVLEPQRDDAAPALVFLFAVDDLVLILAPVLQQSTLVLVKHSFALTSLLVVVDVNVSDLRAFDHQQVWQEVTQRLVQAQPLYIIHSVLYYMMMHDLEPSPKSSVVLTSTSQSLQLEAQT